MDITDFFTIETPPSSSTSKDSTDESLSSFQSKNKFKLSKTNIEQKSNDSNICSTLKSTLISNSIPIKDDELAEKKTYKTIRRPNNESITIQ
ncbi:unnamed protein product [Rotaria sordida]|uniref:Uncharacterized protein n=1 Tax=Rotaria sordida TaxID=392033 RepID=A0A818GRW5_9BILA|nr:unnamed protein product [Rotaria sordida]